jgi:AraC-like DNA-binding protein
LQEHAGEANPIRGSVSSSIFPEQNRLNSWRELFGRQFLRLDIDPLDDDPFHYDTRFLALRGLTVSAGDVSAIRCTRTHELIQDNNDDLVLLIPRRGKMEIRERGLEVVIGTGDAMVRRSSEIGQTLSTPGEFLTMSVPFSAMASQVLDIDRLGFAIFRNDNPTLRLLHMHLDWLLNGTLGEHRSEADRKTLALAARHVQEVAGLLLDNARDNWARLARPGSGPHAARLAAIRADIERHATDPDFSIDVVARRLGISPGYVRKLLAAEGDRFSDLLCSARLELAYRLLGDASHRHATITAIAYHCGFSDVSYFNRCFRQRFDATPGDIRRAGGVRD